MKAVKVYGIFFVIAALMPTQVFAHATWDAAGPTPPRANQNIKVGPCGGVSRGNSPLASTPNAIENIQFKETVTHPGYFEINFSESNDENFVFQQKFEKSVTNKDTYKKTLQMPYELCTDCTLQLIQYMTENPAKPTFYYSCTDLTLTSPNINARITQPLVTQTSISPGNGTITMNWTNPTNATFYKILIVGNAAGLTTNTDPADLQRKLYKVGDLVNAAKNNDKVIYNGKLNNTTIDKLTNGGKYTYQIFAYDINLNYSLATAVSATPSTANVAPLVSLKVKQGSNVGSTVYKDGSDIVISSTVSDGNLADTFTYEWSSLGNNLTDTDMVNSTFTIKGSDANNLLASTYNLSLTVTDSGNLTGSSNTDIILEEKSGAALPIDQVITTSAGCSLSTTAKFDPLLLLLTILSIIAIGFKVRRKINNRINNN